MVLFSHFGHDSPLILIPHFLQWLSTPTTSREDVLVALIIRIITNRIPTAIPISASTIHYNMLHGILSLYFYNSVGIYILKQQHKACQEYKMK